MYGQTLSVQHAETNGMLPGRVGLSAQLISLMRHRECVMKENFGMLIAACITVIASAQQVKADTGMPATINYIRELMLRRAKQKKDTAPI